ncbi:hypothetical protein M3Y99_01271600 [Aphelenchoides fujianensis]|nr:hypothetical protein M3Y99_01271600 [Aphelenchoides fujianensis]
MYYSYVQSAEDVNNIPWASKLEKLYDAPKNWGHVVPKGSGNLPPPQHPLEWFSRKVFLGGLSEGVPNSELQRVFAPFGRFEVIRPRQKGSLAATTYAFLVFERSEDVKWMLGFLERINGQYYASLFAQGRYTKVQVRPWNIFDSKYCPDPSVVINIRYTLFVGGLARTTRAYDLARTFSVFGEVRGVSLDLCPNLLYPKGAARIFFSSIEGYTAGLRQRFVQMLVDGEWKNYEVRPYVAKMFCDECFSRTSAANVAKSFCDSLSCLSYYCQFCWAHVHRPLSPRAQHKPFSKEPQSTGGFRSPPLSPVKGALSHQVPAFEPFGSASFGSALSAMRNNWRPSSFSSASSSHSPPAWW